MTVFAQPVLSGFMHHSTSFASVLYIWIKELVLVIAQFTVAFRINPKFHSKLLNYTVMIHTIYVRTINCAIIYK